MADIAKIFAKSGNRVPKEKEIELKEVFLGKNLKNNLTKFRYDNPNEPPTSPTSQQALDYFNGKPETNKIEALNRFSFIDKKKKTLPS